MVCISNGGCKVKRGLMKYQLMTCLTLAMTTGCSTDPAGDANAAASPDAVGTAVGAVIPDFEFLGFPRPQVATSLVPMHLSDFQAPSPDAVFGDGSGYEVGAEKPKALSIVLAAVWCGPCNLEAEDTLPELRATYAPAGEFILALGEGAVLGSAVTEGDLKSWTERFAVNYPSVLDPTHQLNEVVGPDLYPGNFIVRTRDMKIILAISGVPDEEYWKTFEAVLEDKAVLPED